MLTLSTTTGLRRTQSSNVIAMLPGSDAQLKDEYIVLSAHLDHLGRGSAVNGDSIYNGAHDNAAGMAILLEIAHALHASKARSRRSLLIAAVTAQEKGLLGSDFLARSAQTAGRHIVANINIDMPLALAPMLDFVAIGAQHSTLGAMARSAAASQGYQLAPERFPEEISFIRGDQFSFVRRGIPALALVGGYRARDKTLNLAQMQQQFRTTRYHQPGDDLSLPMDYQTMADLGKVNLRIALAAADASARPRWKPGDFFERTFSRQE
jgi:Zn-dependent M28 family amino/carboxypeptidase